MKLYRVLTLAVVTALCASFFSCSDDDDDDDSNKFNTSYLPKSITYIDGYDNDPIILSYDENSRLTGWDDGDGKYTVVYGKDGKIEKLVYEYSYSEGGQTYTETYTNYYKYEGNKVIVTREHDSYSYEFTINGKGQITAWGDEGDADYAKYSYSGKNLSKIERKENYGTIKYNSTLKYDTNAGIFRNVNTPQWFIYLLFDELGLSVGNNPLTEETIGYFEGVKYSTSKSTYEYVYNNDNYPVSFVLTETYETLGDKKIAASAKRKNSRKSLKSTADDREVRSYTVSYYKK
ncbi:hypothetical protein [Dysgonomonas sp. 520]|uniref:hypothetical protein n=1 Tax=Dysgonomonas sp. 520 TaxID=2302931 RepID=UPI0013D073D7|nr:hypothetical protein [Dysgonomonas sp. 520]NDW09314.1 hypothetical protein [Dysgonomonas sp. 520]